MNTLLKTIPIPLSGLMLGVVALAKLFFLMDVVLPANILFVIGTIFFMLLTMKALFTFKDVVKDLHNPIIASVAPTFTMGTMVIASILMMYNFTTFANGLWLVAVVVQFMLIGFFITLHIVKATVTLQSVFPSWFVTFVGIGMIPVTAPEFAEPFTLGIVYISLSLFIILLPVVLKRVFVARDLPIPTKPMITIIAAPASLCLAAYLTVMDSPNTTMVTVLLIVAQFLYFIILYELQTLIKMPFYPSFGAFTFPLVVSATALYLASKVIGDGSDWMQILLYFEVIIASVIVCYVVVVYTKYLVMHMYKDIKNVSSPKK